MSTHGESSAPDQGNRPEPQASIVPLTRPAVPRIADKAWSITTPIASDQYCELQELMSGIGTYTSAIDGIPGPKTIEAIRASEKRLEREAAGQATVGLLHHLRSSAGNSYGSNTFTPKAAKPANGAALFTAQLPRVAPLRIRTAPGSADYVVKLVSAVSQQTAIIFFVRGGAETSVKVPLGSYQLKYATGPSWLSKTCLFGTRTTFHKADEIFDFRSSGQRISGYTVELISQLHGNLETENIQPNQW